MIVIVLIISMPIVAGVLAWYANRQISKGKKGWV